MDSIWAFLLHTLNVSLVAGLLLLLKWLLRDKLTPRWQYGVWSVLALRIIIPSGVRRYILLPLPLWIETRKGIVEQRLDSVYSSVYAPISASGVFPALSLTPQSRTDWLFVIYALGTTVMLARYILSYARLRLLLRTGSPAPTELSEQVRQISAEHHLKACRVVTVSGLSAPFVCGLLRPILAVPAEQDIDDKVLLHELLHLAHKDPWQTMGWAILRSLHWCNPFLHYVFDRIGNDLETLCDQRVLERLEGEARRDYGSILLQMANERYARAPGTSSVSNGGKNIARRIEAIVRFKTYPKGMSLVSVCILIALVGPTLIGTANAYDGTLFCPVDADELNQAMAAARINRCTTLAGALDTYAKGLMTENGIYIAAASPLSKHQELQAEMYRNCTEEDWVAYHLGSGYGLEYVVQNDGYAVYNLELVTNSVYRCTLGFSVSAFLNEDGVGWRQDENGETLSGSVLVPVLVHNSSGDWVVEEDGARILSYEPLEQQQYAEKSAEMFRSWPSDDHGTIATVDIDAKEQYQIDSINPEGVLAPLRVFRGQGKTGDVIVYNVSVYSVDNTSIQEIGEFPFFLGAGSFDFTPKLNAQFQEYMVWDFARYYCAFSENEPKKTVGMELVALESAEDPVEVSPQLAPLTGEYLERSSGDSTIRWVDDNWDGTLFCGSGGGYTDSNLDETLVALPETYAVAIHWDGKLMETITLEEVSYD